MLEKAESRVETVVVASHDLQLVAAWADRVIVLDEGGIVGDGPPGAVFGDTELLASTGLRQPQVVELGDRLGATRPVLTSDEMVRLVGHGHNSNGRHRRDERAVRTERRSTHGDDT